MKTIDAFTIDDRELGRKLAALNFFQEVRKRDEEQFRQLIEQSRLIQIEPGELLLQRGDVDNFIYFLIKGELQACVDEQGKSVLGSLIPGEVFGEMALLSHAPRTAHIRVPDGARETLVFATCFEHLGDLESHDRINLETKLTFYRQLVYILRWRNDAYRVRFPSNPRASAYYRVPLFKGTPGTQEELVALHRQGVALADRLVELNAELGHLS